MAYNPYWGAATYIQNAITPIAVEPSPAVIPSFTSFADYTSSFSSFVASPGLLFESPIVSTAVDVTYATPGYMTASPLVGTVYNPFSPIVEPLVTPNSTMIIAQPQVAVDNTYYDNYEHHRGKKPLKSKSTPEYCDICKVTCATRASFHSHFSGALHKRKAAQLKREADISSNPSRWKCNLCSVSCTSQDSFYSHTIGTRHIKKIEESQRQNKFIDQNLIPDSYNDSSLVGEQFIKKSKTSNGTTYRCTLCDCEFVDDNSKMLHLKGRRHRLAYKQQKDPEMFVEMQPSKRLKSCLLAARKRIARKEAKCSRLDAEFKVYSL